MVSLTKSVKLCQCQVFHVYPKEGLIKKVDTTTGHFDNQLLCVPSVLRQCSSSTFGISCNCLINYNFSVIYVFRTP